MLLFAALAGAAVADLPLVIVGKGNPKAKAKDPNCVSWWGPNIITTNSNNTLLWASCKTNTPVTYTYLARSSSAGRTWSAPEHVPPELENAVSGGQPTYSRTTNTIFITTAAPKQIAAPDSEERSQASPCAIAAVKLCGQFEGKGASCLACEQKHKAELTKAGCTSSKLSRFCNEPPPPRPGPPPPPGPPGERPQPVWARELPPLTAAQLAKCETGLARSTDGACVQMTRWLCQE